MILLDFTMSFTTYDDFLQLSIKQLTVIVPTPATSYKIGVGNNWLVAWFVCNAVFSETALRIFLIFCMKLGVYKGRKVTELDF